MSLSYVGVDVSKATLDGSVEVNGKVRHHRFSNSPQGHRDFLLWLKRIGIKDSHVCMEATGSYWEAFATHVYKAGQLVSVVNPACIKRFAQCELKRAKTDEVDAGVISRYAKAMQPGSWAPPPPEVQLLQALSRRLHGLVKMRRQELNRQEAEVEPLIKRSTAAIVKTLDAEMEKVRKKIKELLATHEHLGKKSQLLQTIPGVGDETAHMLLAELPDLDLFTDVKQVVAFAGLAPKEIKSGTTIRGRNNLSKTGNSRLRRGLYMCALVAMKWNPVVEAFCARLQERGKPPMKIVGAAMRKLLHIIYGVLKSGKPFCPRPLAA